MGAQLGDAAVLDWPGFACRGFDFDEDCSSGFEADAVWDAGGAGAGEFPAQASVSLDGCFEGVFEVLFLHF